MEQMDEFSTPEFGQGELLGRLMGRSIRAQVLALNFPVCRKVTVNFDDEFISYDLTALASEENREPGIKPHPTAWLETLSSQYSTVIGVHCAAGTERNFENTLGGLIDNPVGRNQKQLAVFFIDQLEMLCAGKPLAVMLESLNLYNATCVENFLAAANRIKDRIESDFARNNQSVVDVVLAFESRLIIERGRITPTHTVTVYPPSLDVLVVVKPVPRGMLHSQLWLMAGFCKYFEQVRGQIEIDQVPGNIQLEYVVTLEIDVEPVPSSLHILECRLRENNSLAAVCGELEIRTDGSFNIIAGAQWFEFKLSCIMSKSVENLYGWVSSLSPAFSMYRWTALTKGLNSYFLPFRDPYALTWTESNLYSVAPERILSRILTCPNGRDRYSVEYEKRAIAKVGSILTFQQFLKNKWQLVSGQWFYVLHTICTNPCPSQMSCMSKILYFIFRIYFYIAMIFSYLSVAGLYLALSTMGRVALEDNSESYRYNSPTGVLQVIYILVFVISLLISTSRSVDRLIGYWKVTMLVYGLLAVSFFAMAVSIIFHGRNNLDASMWLGCTGLVAFMLLPQLHSGSFFKSIIFSIFYMMMIPTYVNILTGISVTKADEYMWTQALLNNTNSKLSTFSRNRTILIIIFVVVNVVAGGWLDYQDAHGNFEVKYLLLACSTGFLCIPLALVLLDCFYRFGVKGCRKIGKMCQSVSNIANGVN